MIIAAPLLAQGSDSDHCESDLPVADASSLGCTVEGSIDQLVQGEQAASSVANGTLDVDIAPGWTETDVVETLRDDEAVWLDPDVGLFFADPIDHLAHPDATPTPISSAQAMADRAALPALSDALRLHSRPGAPRTIFIDVDGHVTSASAWNSLSGDTIVSEPFDMDGDAARFSALERTVIRSVWQRVSEDYAPFDVDVTTEDPGLAALTRSGEQDTGFGVRVIVTSSNWYASGVGGLAYVGSFDQGTPAFVFSSSLGNVDRHIAEAVTHETGHTLGLRHDGTATAGYYTGHAGWAPIMGVGYNADLVQWSAGEYSGADNTEDDIAIISGYVPVVADDHANTPAGATPIDIGETAHGVITTESDVDTFSVDIEAGTAVFDARGAPVASNLDIRLHLMDAAGRRLATSNPATRLGATITRDLAAGRYTVRVDGVGTGDPTTGYSDYGSLGRYSLTVTRRATVSNTLPTARFTTNRTTVLAGQRVVFDGRESTDADGGPITTFRWLISAPTARTVTGPVTAHTWTTPGTYDVSLTVIGHDGRRNTTTRPVLVLRARKALVQDVSLLSATDGSTRLSLAVRDPRGRPVASSRVSVTWGGAASGTSTAVTDSRGRVTITTATPSRTGSVTAVVQRVRPPAGYVWDGRTVTATRAL